MKSSVFISFFFTIILFTSGMESITDARIMLLSCFLCSLTGQEVTQVSRFKAWRSRRGRHANVVAGSGVKEAALNHPVTAKRSTEEGRTSWGMYCEGNTTRRSLRGATSTVSPPPMWSRNSPPSPRDQPGFR